MNRPVKLLGHPVHPMLVVFPAGLLLSSVLVDIAAVAGAGPRALELALGLLGLGLLGGLAAAPFGWLDWRRIPRGTRARRVGAWHGGGNAVAVVLFAVSWFLREPGQPAPAIALGLSLAAGVTMLGTAWLGGELVTRLGVGVHLGANLDAPRSFPSPATLQPPTDRLSDDQAAWASVAGEEDPGAAVDPPALSPSQPHFSEHVMKPRVTVITLGVEDLERAVAFYRDGLGLPTNGIVGQAFENGAVAFFDLQDGLKLAVWPRASMAADARIPLRAGGPLEFTLGHNVIAKDEVDLVMQQASRAGATVVKTAQDTFYGGYAGYFMDPDGHLWEVVYNPDMLPDN